MPLLVEDCPRCGAKNITFDVFTGLPTVIQYRWQKWYELFCVCRNCSRSTVFRVSQRKIDDHVLAKLENLLAFENSLNDHVKVEGYINIRDTVRHSPPDHVPTDVADAFKEGATCLTVECWNASGAMFRMCVDLATRALLPKEQAEGLSQKTRRDLGLRLPWLFEHGRLPTDLRELSSCIREDGNDGVHAGTLTKDDALDLLDFTRLLLERLYTEPERLKLAKNRREVRRQQG